MASHFIEIGGTPHEEDCAQIGVTQNAARYNRLECQAFIAALRKVYGQEPEGAELYIRANSHDFGTYREVACRYDDDHQAAVDYAYKAESGLATWEEAGMWPPVKYHRSQPIHVIEDPAAWSREANPGCHPTIST